MSLGWRNLRSLPINRVSLKGVRRHHLYPRAPLGDRLQFEETGRQVGRLKGTQSAIHPAWLSASNARSASCPPSLESSISGGHWLKSCHRKRLTPAWAVHRFSSRCWRNSGRRCWSGRPSVGGGSRSCPCLSRRWHDA